MSRPMAVGICAFALAIATLSTSASIQAKAGFAGWTTSSGSPTSDARASRNTRCTSWSSWIVPPTTIHVLRRYGNARGTVQTVSFRTWTEYVLGTEMPAYYPLEALKANAVAVKQYGWYYVMHWRGGRAANGKCYDVADTGDGFYRPEVNQPAASQLAAVKATWPYSLRKRDWRSGRSYMFLTGYRAGAFVGCGADSDGFHLFQHSAFDCGKKGLTWEAILRKYMEPRLEIVDPGAHQVFGTGHGDATAMVASATTFGAMVPLTWTSTGTAFLAAQGAEVQVDPTQTLGILSADVTNDGNADLLLLQRTGTGAEILVLRSTGTSYGAPETWWSDDGGLGRQAQRLVAGDFDGDGVVDAGLVSADPVTDRVKLSVLRSLDGHFGDPVRSWSGPLKLDRARVYAGDVNGDSRSDLIIENDRGNGGMEYLVAASPLKGGPLLPAQRWYRGSDLRSERTRTAIGDFDRDGRDDVMLAVPSSAGIKIVGLKALATGAGKFVRSTLWSSSLKDPIAIGNVKMASGDYDSDGRADLVLYVDAGQGTRLIRLKANARGNGLGASVWYTDPTLDGASARIY